MRSDKLSAIKLRKSGQSYNQISQSLNIPKSTLSIWLKNLELSDRAKQKIESRVNTTSVMKLIARNKQQTIVAKNRHQQIRQAAKKEAGKLLSDLLFLSGISLYWAEGYKQGALGSKWKSIDFANSDPQMIKLMVLFFTKFLNLGKDKIRIQIMLHDKRDTEKAVNFWHNITGIPKENFIKTCHTLSRASLQKVKNKLLYGTIQLRINDVVRFFRLIGWIDGLKAKFKI
jgi:hypothetical protein